MRIYQTLGWPADELNSVWWLADGESLATASDDGSVRLWRNLKSELTIESVLNIHELPVKDVICTKSGLLIAGSSDCTVSIWDLEKRALLKRLEGFQDWVRGLACSPDELRLAVASADQTLQIFNLRNFSCTNKFLAHDDFIRAVSWSPDSKYIATVSADGWLKVWFEKTLHVHSSKKFEQGLTCAHWSPDSKYIVVGGVDKKVTLLGIDSCNIIAEMIGHRDTVLSLSWSFKNNHLISGSADRSIRVWDMNSRTCIQLAEGHQGSVRGLTWSPNGDKVASVSADRSLRIWDCFPLKKELRLLCDSVNRARKNWVRSASFNLTASVIALGMEDRAIEIIRLGSGSRTNSIMRMEGSTSIGGYTGSGKAARIIERKRKRTEEWVRCIAWHPFTLQVDDYFYDGLGSIAVASDDSGVRIINLEHAQHELSKIRDDLYDWALCDRFTSSDGTTISCISWSNHGSYLAIGVGSKICAWFPAIGGCNRRYRSARFLYEPSFGKANLIELNAHRDRILSVLWIRGDKEIISSSVDLSVLRWDLANEKYHEYKPVDTEILFLAASPDQSLIAGAGSDSCIYIWHIDSLDLLKSVKLHNEPVHQIRWSDDSQFLVSASRHGCVKVLDVNSWKTIWMLPAPTVPHISLDIEISADDSMKFLNTDLQGKVSIRTAIVPIDRSSNNTVKKVFSKSSTGVPNSKYSIDIQNVSMDLNISKLDIVSAKELKIFISYAREDRDLVYPLYQKLKKMGFSPWIDEADALPGIEWRVEIPRVVRDSDIVLVCLTNMSTRKSGYLQKEIRTALEAAQERVLGEIYIIPVRFEDCEIPNQLAAFHAVNLFEEKGLELLIKSLSSKVRVNK